MRKFRWYHGLLFALSQTAQGVFSRDWTRDPQFRYDGRKGMFIIEQTYDRMALTVLCRAARKSVRRIWRIARGVIWTIFAFGALLLAYMLAQGIFDASDIPMVASEIVILLALLLEDRLNAWIALRQMIPGTAHSKTEFAEDAYTVTTTHTQTRWEYENITALCETERYFICFIGKRHGQLFDKEGFQWGSPDAFRSFLEQKTGKTFQYIK